MKSLNPIFYCAVFFTLALISCQEKHKGPGEAQIAEEEEIDVYANPNTFEGIKMRIGDDAPDIQASKWYNSEPITSFQKGKVYVVEFWASWCQPCRKSIPHLNNLSQEFAEDLNIIGIAAAEEKGPENLEKLLNKLGDKLSYPVAYTESPTTFRDYMVAANNTGLPWAFVIDRAGKIAWWGQPFFSQFEPILRSVLDETYVRKDGEIPLHADNNHMKEMWDLQEAFWTAYSDENWWAADSLGTALLDSRSELFYYEVASLFEIKYLYLTQEEEAIVLADNLTKGMLHSKPEGLSLIASVINEDENSDSSQIEFGIETAQQLVGLTNEENPSAKLLLVELLMKKGDDSMALVVLQSIDKKVIDEDLLMKIEDLSKQLNHMN